MKHETRNIFPLNAQNFRRSRRKETALRFLRMRATVGFPARILRFLRETCLSYPNLIRNAIPDTVPYFFFK